MGILWFVLTLILGTIILVGINKFFTIVHFGFKPLITFIVSTYFVVGFVIGMMFGTINWHLFEIVKVK